MTSSRPIPPLIETAISPLVRLRDRILTLAAWVVSAVLLRNALLLIWDFLRPPVFRLTDDLPGWRVVLGILLEYQLALEVLALWVLCWGLSFSLQRRAVGRRAAITPPVSRAELAAAVGVPVATLSAMEGIKLIDVDVADDARIAAVTAFTTVA
jgi:poly-beta-1,6-N-acetyl-D-glucosamine biosynthesis protein PgaD